MVTVTSSMPLASVTGGKITTLLILKLGRSGVGAATVVVLYTANSFASAINGADDTD